ncbi:MAG: hypothetical protein V3T24_10580, partial [Longimicrobiales bacterium]
MDRWLGVPVCVVMTVARRLVSWLRAAPRSPVKRIVFLKLAEQGSTVLACPAIRRAVEMVGRDNVYFLVFEENRFILDVIDLIDRDNVLSIPTEGLASTIRGALKAIRRMRRLLIDTTIDLEFFARSTAALCFLSGASRRVGFHAFGGEGPYRGNLMTHRLIFNPHLHTAQTFRMMVEALNVPPQRLPTFDLVPGPADDPAPPFQPEAEEVEHVRALLGQAADTEDTRPLVLLNANASDLMPLRRWPPGRYVELARRLLKRYPALRVAMTGAPEEQRVAAGLVDQVDSKRC